MIRRFEHSRVFHPTRTIEFPASDLGRTFEEVHFKSRDKAKLHGWYFPAPVDSPRAALAVLFCHGNGGNISSRPGYYRVILEAGVNLFTFDYRGYGQSEGEPSEAGTYLDAQAAYAWLRAKGFESQNILLWGESLGGGVASELATRERVAGLLLQSTFTSVPDVGVEVYPWLPVRWLSTIKYDTHSKLRGILCPVVILHSRADKTVSYRHAERNHAAAGEPKLLWEIRGDHNDALTADLPRFVEGTEKFFRLVELRGKPAKPDAPETKVATVAATLTAPAPEPTPAPSADVPPEFLAEAPLPLPPSQAEEPFEAKMRRRPKTH